MLVGCKSRRYFLRNIKKVDHFSHILRLCLTIVCPIMIRVLGWKEPNGFYWHKPNFSISLPAIIFSTRGVFHNLNLSINRILYINTLRIYKMFFFKQEKSLFFSLSLHWFLVEYITLIFTVTVQSLPILIWNDPNYITIRISVIREIRSHRKFQVQCSNLNVSSSYHKVQCSNLKVQRLKSSKVKGHL